MKGMSCLTSAAVLVVCPFALWASEPPAASTREQLRSTGIAAPVQSASLTLELRVDQGSLILGEPLFLTARMKNKGTELLKIYNQNSPTYQRKISPIAVLLSEKGGKLDHWSDHFRPRYKTRPRELFPGQEINGTFVVLFQARNGFAFARPGAFWVSLKVICTDMSEVQSQPIAITVTRPAGESLDAWNRVSTDDFRELYGELIQAPWQVTLDVGRWQKCDDFIKDYPTAPHGAYLALALGRCYQEGPIKNAAMSLHYLEIAKSRASWKPLKAKVLDAIADNDRDNPSELSLGKPGAPPEQPVDPKLQKAVEVVFEGFLAAQHEGDLERCLKLTAEDYRGWSRDKQREEFQEAIDSILGQRRRGIPIEYSAKVLSVARSGDDVLITASMQYWRDTQLLQDKTIGCRLRKYGDQWLIQDWNTLDPK